MKSKSIYTLKKKKERRVTGQRARRLRLAERGEIVQLLRAERSEGRCITLSLKEADVVKGVEEGAQGGGAGGGFMTYCSLSGHSNPRRRKKEEKSNIPDRGKHATSG